MTVSEYITKNCPFYHITPLANKPGILDQGLIGGPLGICVVRSPDERIIKMIAIGQLTTLDVDSDMFCVFKIAPSKHNLAVGQIRPDFTTEFTNPLHNYIKLRKLWVDEDDIFINEICIPSTGIANFEMLESELSEEGLILELEY